MTDPVHYFVTDIEADGPSVYDHSMLSFATVCVREDGEILDQFEANMTPLSNRNPDPRTTRWWETEPEAFQNTQIDARQPSDVMPEFVQWVGEHIGRKAFAARPLLFDGGWIDFYLLRFADRRVFEVPYWHKPLFECAALDLESYLYGTLGRTAMASFGTVNPPEWLGDHPHTHKAIDDALGYAVLLSNVLKMQRGHDDIPKSMRAEFAS